MSRCDIANFKGQPTASREGIFGRGGGTVRKKNAVHEEARISEKKREKRQKGSFYTHICVGGCKKIREAHIVLPFLRPQRIFFSKFPSPSHLFSRLRGI